MALEERALILPFPAAAPAVSGAIALVLERRPELSWRDVQGILAMTSRKLLPVDPDEPYDWTTNAAGFSHHPMYGFGVINATAAVVEATGWELWGEEQSETKSSGDVNKTIPNDSTLVASTVAADCGFSFTESVMVKLHLVSNLFYSFDL
jgi:Subtilase family